MKYRILTAEEYDRHKYILPNPGRRFWLDKAETQPKRCGFVNEEGVIDRFGTFCSDTTVGLRPVIEYEPGEKREIVFNEGQAVLLHGLRWTAISEDILVCDRCVEELKFDDVSNDFDNSYIKYALYQYFKRITSEEQILEQAALPSVNEVEDENGIEVEFSKSMFSNLLFMFLAVAAGIVCALSFSPISISVFAIVVICMATLTVSYNVKKVKEAVVKDRKKRLIRNEKNLLSVSVSEPEISPDNLRLDAKGIEDSGIKEKVDEINGLFEALEKTGNKTAKSKVKFFYLPEMQKTLELYGKLYENGIETPNSIECMDIIRGNLDKTIKLLTMDYDKAVSESLLETKLSGGVIGKMLDDAERSNGNLLLPK
ncbi:MAG: hypothetical protein IKP88_02020 [Lachnospiraceae bacterium]|nr:hypothetical protein [Lachnospiraceae bacterium]